MNLPKNQKTLKILNLYSGIGGNRKLWNDVNVTAVENDIKIAEIYSSFFPNDKIIIDDAHKFLLNHYSEFDFIWSSPPCPTHSRFNNLNTSQNKKLNYPDMKLYQEIIFLQKWFKGKYCVENVISYYKPLIPCIESGSHYYWTNFYFKPLKSITRNIRTINSSKRIKQCNFDLSKFEISQRKKIKLLNNCVEPEHARHILNYVFAQQTENINLFSENFVNRASKVMADQTLFPREGLNVT